MQNDNSKQPFCFANFLEKLNHPFNGTTMSIKDYLAGAKQAGTVQKLMTPGLAVEFIQPWYTPLSTTPSTTGIAVGGIGSTFTATPAGTTPVMNVMPGVQVRTEKPSDLRFNNFFFKEAVLSAKAALVIGNFAAFGIYNNNFPLLDLLLHIFYVFWC